MFVVIDITLLAIEPFKIQDFLISRTLTKNMLYYLKEKGVQANK